VEVDESVIFLPVNPDKTGETLRKDSQTSDKMTKLAVYFHYTSRLPKMNSKAKKLPIIWATARIAYDDDWEDIANVTSYNLEEAGIMLLKKRVQCFKTEGPGYILFVDNQTDPLDLVSQIQDNIGTSYEWTLYNNKPWKNSYRKEKLHSKLKEMLQKVLHDECKAGKLDEFRFGEHTKLVKALTNKSPSGQVDRTIRMNGHGQRFQASVDMVEFQGLESPLG